MQAAEFNTVMSAFNVLDFNRDEVETVWSIVASVLHIGNLDFMPDENDNERTLLHMGEVDHVAKLLSVNTGELYEALTSRVIAAHGEVVRKRHNVGDAQVSRDSFAKALYERLFTWIVSHVNSAIDPSLTSERGVHINSTVIGVLDIYGFEVFDNNSFEQFCINYCNEKLQQLFIELVLKQQQEEYEREGIKWVHIDYFNNEIICNLIDQPHQGVMALMDEACLGVGRTTDRTLLEAMDSKLARNAHYTSRQLNATKNKHLEFHRDFEIKHYAGNVVYNVNGFIEKNKDTLFQDFKRLLYNSSDETVSSMWPEGAHDILQTTKRPQTAGTIFKNSMHALVKILCVKEPFYVRCIKPNELKSAHAFDDERVKHQIAYLGLIENVRVRRAGFANRQEYTRFVQRYAGSSASLCPRRWHKSPPFILAYHQSGFNTK